jgi:hypothetical protein
VVDNLFRFEVAQIPEGAVIPEPLSLTLLAVGTAFLARRRFRHQGSGHPRMEGEPHPRQQFP